MLTSAHIFEVDVSLTTRGAAREPKRHGVREVYGWMRVRCSLHTRIDTGKHRCQRYASDRRSKLLTITNPKYKILSRCVPTGDSRALAIYQSLRTNVESRDGARSQFQTRCKLVAALVASRPRVVLAYGSFKGDLSPPVRRCRVASRDCGNPQ